MESSSFLEDYLLGVSSIVALKRHPLKWSCRKWSLGGHCENVISHPTESCMNHFVIHAETTDGIENIAYAQIQLLFCFAIDVPCF